MRECVRSRAEFPFRRQQSAADLFLVTLLPEPVPADVVSSVVFLDVVFGSLQWVVGALKGPVEQGKGFFAAGCFVEEPQCEVADGVGRVERAAVECFGNRPRFSVESE
ncbi:MAG: hypothetical protein Ct9H300mP1_11260 [Planctomycetaceae bacterium]|nr:MAG: hypothetical protein Ct9H300mP1_11260 [Planctomycetaceae bacterium]